jgi:hypothetical protein
MKPEDQKKRSRGISTDMSPEAILKRFNIMIELDIMAKMMKNAKPIQKIRKKKTPAL